MNSAFRDVIFVNDLTLFRAWLLALVVSILGANMLESFGIMGDAGLRRQIFAPIAAIVGGYIFGLGIVVGGGCGTGILYKQGEGQLAALLTTFTFGLTLMATQHGPLKPIAQLLRGYKVSVGTDADGEPITNPALWDIFGAGSKWIVIGVIVAIFAAVVLKGKPFGKQPKKGWSWSLGGALVGLIVVMAWYASYMWGGQARGISAAGPTTEAFLMTTMGNSMAKDPMFDFWGITTGSWSALYVLGIPLGAFISAKGLSEFKLTIPKDPNEIVRVIFGGVVMGFGAGVAGG
jgi:uncharacterized membrane protein YedE/YeeE